ncbi:hypothetical protein L195_g034733 [Trifolium pratense]|uniref:Uncharacterized protein n=2 Tax=Trifolium pratense TaxID=57577 RepID=A0A2K3LJN8_TRIPR|nr:hypothetical protein L195_g034733 [Trifolium pratense]CAJ2648152.1 unnamed protein product [Trifolium pratense]
MGLQGPDISKIIHFLSVCILAFINEGSSSLSSSFMNDPWSMCLSVPISLYFKFALEAHAHLGICVGIGIPSLVYWGATRSPIDWYWETVVTFNVEIMKTGIFNIIIGVLHLLVSKLIHHLIEWINDRKIKLKGLSFLFPEKNSELENSTFYEHPLLRPVSSQDIILKSVEALISLFFNGNVLLISWCFSGQVYTHEVGKAISWVGLGSSMFVWVKALLKLMEMPQITPEEKVYKVEKNQNSSIDEKKESKDQELVTCSLEC